MQERLEERVIGDRQPVLGVCVGMQILARRSDEGSRQGLGWIDGAVRAFSARRNEQLAVPHMGWNDVSPAADHPLFRGLETEGKFYFLHSYYFDCDRGSDVAATAHYGEGFTAAVSSGNIHGVQFHPEKSHHYGIRLLQNFAEV
jgi:glutamine amidotransferase